LQLSLPRVQGIEQFVWRGCAAVHEYAVTGFNDGNGVLH
jgi:hypothetical protein